MFNTRAVFDGSHRELIINGPPQSIEQNILYVLDASVPTNAITQSPNFGLASWGQLLNKQPFGNTPVVAYDTVNVILSPQTINHSALAARILHLSHRLTRRLYRRYFSPAIAEFGPQLEQVAVANQWVQDIVL
ncbi:MAG: hypothetical protein EZS28_035406 [Streblomastix strix]|uniref:Uncharacterized protein n=1 Tax=Streblomastix strix TaxID=222440 RepID=A0A5J4UEL0_9EUKA|nr:MAG: hypothetical protein EZS28_035406 [Streblomastix strix]